MVQAVSFTQFYFIVVTLLTRQIACHLNPDDVDTSKFRSAEHVFRAYAIRQSSTMPIAPERAPLDAPHQVIFVVRQKNMETLTKFVDDVSDPKNANYGNFKTRDEIGVMTENVVASKTVKAYLIRSGAKVTEVSPYQEYITAVAPVYVWEKMLDTRFHQYNFSTVNDSGYPVTIYRADRYSIPLKLDTAVISVLDTVQMPELQKESGITVQSLRVPRKSQGSNSLQEEDKNVITPAILIKSYDIDTSLGHPRATQSIFEAINVHIGIDDVAQFQKIYNLPKVYFNSSVGGHADATTQFCHDNFYTCMEGNLDAQYLLALSPKSPTISHYAVNFHSWTVWLIELASSKNIPLVMSISYCSEEATIDMDEQQAFNTMAIKLSAMGVTLVVASGDAGATTNWRFNCEYTPQFPASCPYVLTVGGTMVSRLFSVYCVSLQTLTTYSIY
jgi:tripeptidyl-peptidase I